MPSVSVIMPIYDSAATLEHSLLSLRSQTFRPAETVLVDSSPDPGCQKIVEAGFPEVRLVRSLTRLLAHEALNLGVSETGGELLAFTDPDAYAEPDWLEKLVEHHLHHAGPVIGGVSCYGERWLDLGAHLVKFDKWLPAGEPRELSEGPTVNLLLPRKQFEEHGPFPEAHSHADTELCWRLRRKRIAIRFAPEAIVAHHHLHTWTSLLAERFSRGVELGRLRARWDEMTSGEMAWRALASFVPLRLISQLRRIRRNAMQGGLSRPYVVSFPVIASALYAGILGEALGYLQLLSSVDRPG